MDMRPRVFLPVMWRPVRAHSRAHPAQSSPSVAQVIRPVCHPKPPVPHDLLKIEFLMPGEKLPHEVYFSPEIRKWLINMPLSLLTAFDSALGTQHCFTRTPPPTRCSRQRS